MVVVLSGIAVRLCTFVIQAFLADKNINTDKRTTQFFLVIMWSLPAFLFCTGYLVIIFFVAETYSKTYSPTAKHRYFQIFVLIAVVMYATLVIFYVIDAAYKKPFGRVKVLGQFNDLELALWLLIFCMYFATSVAFAIFGLWAYLLTKKNPSLSDRMRAMSLKIRVLSVSCMVIWTGRCILVACSAVLPNAVIFLWWGWHLVYYVTFEMIPIVLMIMIIHSKLGPKSDDDSHIQDVGKSLLPQSSNHEYSKI